MARQNFFRELKRRNVYRVAITYGITSWLLAQIAGLAVSSFGAPDWVMKIVLVLLIIGFPVALILAWAFELSPEGIVRTSSLAAENSPYPDSRKKTWTSNLFIGGLLLALVAQFIYFNFWKKSSAGLSTREKSIAVLPFENMTGNEGQEYMSDGFTEEIIFRLSQIEEFSKVISRTSVMAYKGTRKAIPEIARELGVAHILEGSFRKHDDQLRITVQLIDGNTDDHIWSEIYNRPYDNLFAVQSEVAEKVAYELHATITASEKSRIEDRPTDNLEAYEYFLQAENYYDKWRKPQGERQQLEYAWQMYQKASELDPGFTNAYLGKIECYIRFYHMDMDSGNEKWVKLATTSADTAYRLNSELTEVWIQKAKIQYHLFRNYDKALEFIGRAELYSPKNLVVYEYKGLIDRRRNNWESALSNFERAYEINPRDYGMIWDFINLLTDMRLFQRADSIYYRYVEFDPELQEEYMELKSWIDLMALGMIPSKEDFLNEYHYYNRNWQELLALEKKEKDSVSGRFAYYPHSYFLSDFYKRLGDTLLADRYADSTILEVRIQIEKNGADYRYYSTLGLSYAIKDMSDSALVNTQKAIELMPYEEDAWEGYRPQITLARVYTMIGEHNLAIQQLGWLLSSRGMGSLTISELKTDPDWDPLRDNPAFRELLKRPEFQIN